MCRTSEDTDHMLDKLQAISSFNKIVRILAYCLKWRRITIKKTRLEQERYLSASEIATAKERLFRVIQGTHFLQEIMCIEKHQPIPNKSTLHCLSLLLCENGLLRIGGRLQNANLTYDETHPIILPRNTIFTHRLIEHAHVLTLHGVQLMMSHVVAR